MLPNSTWGFPQYIRVTMEAGLLQMVGRCRNKLNITAKVTVFGRSQSAHNLAEVMSTMPHYSNPESESSTRPSDEQRTPVSLSPITTPSQPVGVFETPPPSGSPPAPRRIQRPSTRSVQDNIERAVAEFKHQMEDPEASIHILPGVPAPTDRKPRAGSFLNQPRSPNDTVDQILAEIQRYTRGTYSSLREDFAHAASKDCFDTFLQVADSNGVVVQVEAIRSLLCLRSPVFRQSLGERMAKGVTMTNVDVQTVVSLVEFCHTDSCGPLKADFSADPVATIADVLRLYQFAVVTQTETLRERLDLKILEGLILSTTIVKEAVELLLVKCAGISQIEVPLRSLLLKVSRAA
ncbi:MAG: hypothetical protein KVP17_004444 [Porospora cf. gigantea B]|nr:MAG: hypothetical protein KVP17_004444 [Porospora cf. gigantea B]